MTKKTYLILSALLITMSCSTAYSASLTLRAGTMLPQGGDFKDISKLGWSVDLLANVKLLPIPMLSTVIFVNSSGFANKQKTVDDPALCPSCGGTFLVESKITSTGGGIGVRLAPTIPAISPFAELLARISSLKQDFKVAGTGTTNSKTKLGYQINVGLKFAFVPKLGLEVGGSYFTYSKTKLKLQDVEKDVTAKAIGAFVGLSLGLGL